MSRSEAVPEPIALSAALARAMSVGLRVTAGHPDLQMLAPKMPLVRAESRALVRDRRVTARNGRRVAPADVLLLVEDA